MFEIQLVSKTETLQFKNKRFLSGETDMVRDSTAEIRGTSSIQITGVTDEICIQ